MKEVQVFKKTLLSVAVVTVLGGYGSYSEAQITVQTTFFNNKSALDLNSLRNQLSQVKSGDPGFREVGRVRGLLDDYEIDVSKVSSKKLPDLNEKLRQDLENSAKQLLVWDTNPAPLGVTPPATPTGTPSGTTPPVTSGGAVPPAAPSGTTPPVSSTGTTQPARSAGGKTVNVVGTQSKAKMPQLRVKVDLPVVDRTVASVVQGPAGKTQKTSTVDGSAYGLNTPLKAGTDQDYKARVDAHLNQFLQLKPADLKKLVLVEKSVSVGTPTKPKFQTQMVVPDRIVLKNLDLSDAGVRTQVLTKLAKDLGDVFSYQSDVLGFKTEVLEESDVHSGFVPSQVMPAVQSASTANTTTAGRVLLNNKTDAVHKGFGSANKALDALVVHGGASARVADGGAIYSTVVFVKDAAELTGVKAVGAKGKEVAENTFVDVIGVLPTSRFVTEEYEENGTKKKRSIRRINTELNIDGLKSGKFNAKGVESISIANAKVETSELGFDNPAGSAQAKPYARKLALKNAEVSAAIGGKGLAGQSVSLENTRLHVKSVEAVVEPAKTVNGKQVAAVVKAIPLHRPVTVSGLNEVVQMESSNDGFKTVTPAGSSPVDDVLSVSKGSVAYVSLKDVEKVSISDSEVYASDMGAQKAPLTSLEMSGKAALYGYSKSDARMYLSRDVGVVLAKDQEIVKDIQGFKSFVVDGGVYGGNLTGYPAEAKIGDPTKDAKRFPGSSVELRSGTYKGGFVDVPVPVKVTGDFTVKPESTELKALDIAEIKKHKKAVFEKTAVREAAFNAPLAVKAKGNLIIHKMVVKTVAAGTNAPTVAVSPGVIAKKGMTFEKGAGLTVMLDLNDTEVATKPFVSATGWVKLEGQNRLTVGVDQSVKQRVRELHEASKAGKAVITGSVAVLEADKIDGDFTDQGSMYPFLTVSKGSIAKSIAGKQLYSVDVTYNHNPVDNLKKMGLSNNYAKMYASMNEAVLGGADSDESHAMFLAMADATSKDQAVELTNQMMPHAALNYSVQQASVTIRNKAVESIARHLSNTRTGINTGDMFESQGFWAEYIGSKGDMDDKDGILGYDTKVNGVNLGFDAMLNDQTTVGFAFTMAKADINTNDIRSDITADTYMGTLYSGWTMDDYFFDAMLSYGHTKNKFERKNLALSSGIIGKYKAEADSSVWGASFATGYNYDVNQWTLQPRVELNYADVDLDDLDEKVRALAQKVKFSDYEVLELGAGLRVMGEFGVESGVLRPEFNLMGYHDFKDDKGKVKVAMANPAQSVQLEGMDREQDRVVAGLGVNFEMQNNLSLGIHYEHNWMGDYKSNSLNANVRYDF